MKNIVIITANPKTEGSASLLAASYTEKKLLEKYPEANVVTHNLAFDNILELNQNLLSGVVNAEEQEIIASRQKHLEEFLNADLVVLSMPMWNHFYPAQFKLYIDSLWAAKTTFAYNASGDIYGLLEGSNKQVMIIASMGGLNSFKGNDFGYAYAKDTFISFGLKEAQIKYVPIQGTALLPQDGHSMSIGLDKAVEKGYELIDFTLSSYK